ncbi:MAG: AAA family ATPase [Muribaculaceae bacterium]|nr:AAA family ATPase [Muribaculaceae bacterium]
MKIKRLVIRNIASIEKGEIDFEKGLIDKETQKPASLFLITGDTGSGKSVILDCISMALYGTTPRVKSVNGINNNVYQNNNGEEISVNDITQYTRIGISWKDECFAELTFMGNDNIEYVSRFSLGRTNRNRYRSPEWKLCIGDNEIIENRKSEIKARIEQAVGLSFEQFSRMAMLAQGQFATFLTGRKEERERILEQLTATDIFSRYGEAITAIFKESKQEYENYRKILQEFSKKILGENMRQELSDEMAIKNTQADKCHKETVQIRQRISCTEALIKAINDINSLQEENKKLSKLEETPEYRKRISIVQLWDNTTAQRESLSDKLKASESLKAEKKSLQEKKVDFLVLSDDFFQRVEDANANSLRLEQLKLWIDSQQPLKTLFSKSSIVISNLNNYLTKTKDITRIESETIKVQAKLENIAKEISSQKEKVTNKNNLCIDCHNRIHNISLERDSLKPVMLRIESNNLQTRKSSLKDVLVRIENHASEIKEREKAEKEIASMAKSISELATLALKASEECTRLEKDKENSEGRYRTMLISVEENFKALRRQLAEEHASHCPLCGQSIKDKCVEWNNEVYFSNILTPLEEEKKKCAAEYSSAKEKADKISKELNTLSGELKAKETELTKRKNFVLKTENEINEIIKSLEIDTSDNLHAAISAELDNVEKKIMVVSEKLKQSDKLQNDIDKLRIQKDSLDKDLKLEEKSLQDLLTSQTKSEETLKMSRLRLIELCKEKDDLFTIVSDDLKDYANDWMNDPDAIAIRLKQDADEFSDKTSTYEKSVIEHNAHLKTLDAITRTKNALSCILESFATLENVDSNFHNLKKLNLEAVGDLWSDFHIKVISINQRIADNESKIHSLDKKLHDYYEHSGNSEATLMQLLKAADEISHMRREQDRHLNEKQKVSTLLADALKKKQENMHALNIEDESKIESIVDLKAKEDSLLLHYRDLTQRLGAIKEKLDADAETRKETESKRSDLEKKRVRMEKWEKMNSYFGGTRFRTLVQSHILRPLLHNANLYLRQITDHYTLTCSDVNEQLSILVRDRYHNNEPRSVTVLSGGERFMVSLALSLALSAMNRPDMNVDILFIDEGFGTLDAKSLEMVMNTLRQLPEINGNSGRRVGVISHREELAEQIDCQIQLQSFGEGRSRIVIPN